MAESQTVVLPRRLGDYLPCSAADVEWAISCQRSDSRSGCRKRLGEILVEGQRITPEDLVAALRAQRADRLRQSSLFARLSDDELARMSEIAEEVSLGTGETILEQDQDGDCLYVIAAGRVLVYRRNESLVEIPIIEASAGDVLGEMSYFSDGTRSASARTITDAQLLKIPYESLTGLLSTVPALAVGLLHLVTKRLRKIDVLYAESRSQVSGL